MAANMINFFSGSQSSSPIGGPLDVQSIVEQIISAKKTSMTSALNDYQTLYNARKQAFQELNLKVSALESSLYNIKASFNNKTVNLSNSDFLTATASSSAQTGTFRIIVGQLAQSQSSSSAVFDSPTDLVLNEGTTFKISQNGVEKSIAISGQNRSLNSLKNAINSLGMDLSASVIFDGSKYRLQITGKKTGTENAFSVTDDGVGTNMTTLIEAKDAEIYVNSPADENYKISRSSNTISDVISGVTLNLKAADLSKSTTLEIRQDSSAIKEKVKDFVNKFNDAITYLNSQFEYDNQKQAAGALSGDAAARQVQYHLLTKVAARIEGISDESSVKSIANIGLTLTKEGKLQLDETKFEAAVTEDLTAVKRVFTDLGTSANPSIAFLNKTANTRAGNYAVFITQEARKAEMTGSYEVPDFIAQDETLSFTVGANNYNIELKAGQSFAEVISSLNSFFIENGLDLKASASGNYLKISSGNYGSNQMFTVVSSVEADGNGTGIGTTPVTAQGQDIGGTIGGSAATGSGQVLTSLEGDSRGLSIFIESSTLGDIGSIYLTFSPLESLRQTLFDISLPYQGLIAKNIDALDQQLENIDLKIADINSQLAKEADLLISQFTKANEALVQLQYLQSSLNNSAAIWKG